MSPTSSFATRDHIGQHSYLLGEPFVLWAVDVDPSIDNGRRGRDGDPQLRRNLTSAGRVQRHVQRARSDGLSVVPHMTSMAVLRLQGDSAADALR